MTLRAALADATVLAAWCTLGSPAAAEVAARAGFAAVALDEQHGLFAGRATADAIAAIHAAGASSLVRIAVGDLAGAARALDLGAACVIAPMIDSAADAAAFAAAVKYPPVGTRSWGPVRALPWSGLAAHEFLATANDRTLALAMIETPAAVADLDAILATDGVDGVFVGPTDLSIALSRGARIDPLGAEVTAVCARIAAAARAAGKVAGAYAVTTARARELAELGFRLVGVSSDAEWLAAGARAALA